MTTLAFITGAALGGCTRHLVSAWLDEAHRPLGTLLVNTLGCFVLGLVLGGTTDIPAAGWPLFFISFCGTFTTVSSFAAQFLYLAKHHGWKRAAAHLSIHLACCLPAAASGIALATP